MGDGAAPPPASFFNMERLRAGLKKYGRTGLYTYLGFSTCVTASIYVALENHVDVKKVLGIKEDDPDKEPSFVEKYLIGKGSNLALAVICSKMLVPVKLPVAMAVTPYVQRFVESFAKKAPKAHP